MYVQPPGDGAVIRSLVGLKRRLGMAPPPSQSTFGPAPSPGGGSRRSRADGGGGATPGGGARSPGGGNWLARHAPARGAAGDVLTLSVGLAVRARYRATALGVFGTQWFDGEVRAVHDDGTCDVLYEDGDVELRVAPHYVKELVLYNLGPRYRASVPPWRGTPPPSAGTDERPEPELVDSKDEHDAVCRSTAAALTAAAYDVEAWPLRDESDDDEVGVEGAGEEEEEEERATEEVATAAVAPPKPKPPKPKKEKSSEKEKENKKEKKSVDRSSKRKELRPPTAEEAAVIAKLEELKAAAVDAEVEVGGWKLRLVTRPEINKTNGETAKGGVKFDIYAVAPGGTRRLRSVVEMKRQMGIIGDAEGEGEGGGGGGGGGGEGEGGGEAEEVEVVEVVEEAEVEQAEEESPTGANPDSPPPPRVRPPRVGDAIEVEVASSGGETSWQPAEVVVLLPQRRLPRMRQRGVGFHRGVHAGRRGHRVALAERRRLVEAPGRGRGGGAGGRGGDAAECVRRMPRQARCAHVRRTRLRGAAASPTRGKRSRRRRRRRLSPSACASSAASPAGGGGTRVESARCTTTARCTSRTTTATRRSTRRGGWSNLTTRSRRPPRGGRSWAGHPPVERVASSAATSRVAGA